MQEREREIGYQCVRIARHGSRGAKGSLPRSACHEGAPTDLPGPSSRGLHWTAVLHAYMATDSTLLFATSFAIDIEMPSV